MTRNIGTQKLCNRAQCLVCTAPEATGRCSDQSVTYQISCMREPCINELDILKPTNVPQHPQQPVALYVGETSRSCFYRGEKHLYSYRHKEHDCSLWRHTVSHHNSQIGPDRGLKDYKMVKISSRPKPLDRLTAEGALIKELEGLQTQGRAICLNSKKDFKQSHAVSLNFNMGANSN